MLTSVIYVCVCVCVGGEIGKCNIQSCCYHIRNIFKVITKNAWETLVNTLITSRLDYGNARPRRRVRARPNLPAFHACRNGDFRARVTRQLRYDNEIHFDGGRTSESWRREFTVYYRKVAQRRIWFVPRWRNVCVCVCVCIYIYIYIYIEREREMYMVFLTNLLGSQ